jgi:thiosulfate/3-mercaptopyruvate sulfurtransferase
MLSSFLAVVMPASAAGPRGAMLVSPAWLIQHLKDPDLVLLHVGDRAGYEKGHLPGARLFGAEDVTAPMDHATMKPTDLHVELPALNVLRDHLAAVGISNSSRIVVYFSDVDAMISATRVVWTLDYAGLGPNTALLDGGLPAWLRDGDATTTDVPAAAKPGALAPLKPTGTVAQAAFMTAHAKKPGVVLVDARDAAFYDGVQSSNGKRQPQQFGHIPGAVSIPFTSMFDDSGTLLPADSLQTIFTHAGIQPNDTVVAYCHIGLQATVVLFVARSLGHTTMLYDGSMNDWTNRQLPLEMPVKKGAGGS